MNSVIYNANSSTVHIVFIVVYPADKTMSVVLINMLNTYSIKHRCCKLYFDVRKLAP